MLKICGRQGCEAQDGKGKGVEFTFPPIAPSHVYIYNYNLYNYYIYIVNILYIIYIIYIYLYTSSENGAGFHDIDMI